MCPADELALLRACLHKPVSVYDLSHFHNPRHMLDAEKLGYLARSHDRQFYSITEKGKARFQHLSDLLDARLYAAQQQAEQQSQQEHARVQNRLEQSKADKKVRRGSWAQTVFALVAAPLLTLLIEHFDFVTHWLSSVMAHVIAFFQ